MFITVVNQKGGVGKTTLSVHLAVWLHERGLRVALIDADGQAASTRWVEQAELGIHHAEVRGGWRALQRSTAAQ